MVAANFQRSNSQVSYMIGSVIRILDLVTNNARLMVSVRDCVINWYH